jgi:hypothetical protein
MFKVKDELAGKKIKCPKCARISSVAAGEIQSEMIPVRCHCGKSYQAKASMSGKSFKCSACKQSVLIPKSGETTEMNSDPFGSIPATNNTLSLFDENFPDLGLPTAPHIPYQAPPTQATVTVKTAREKSPGINIQFNQDTLVSVTAILCILFGISRFVLLNPMFLLMSPKLLLSVGGLIYLVNALVCLGILVAGIGLLLDQEWAIGVGQIAASMFFVLVLINIVMFLANIGIFLDGKTRAISFVRSISLFLGEITGSSVAPGLLLYVTLREK